MNKIIGVTELQRNFRAVFDEVVEHKTPYVLTRGSKPEVVMISYDEWLRVATLAESDLMVRLERTLQRMAERNADRSDDEVEADVAAARRTVRRKRGSKAR